MIIEVENNDNRLIQFLKNNKLDKPIDSPFSREVIYMTNDIIIGYLSYSVMYEKAEINNIYVSEQYRSQGIGSKLLDYLVKKCKICENITLEVRKNNINAISLYKKYGFKEVAIREKYYNGVDGVLMMLEVK